MFFSWMRSWNILVLMLLTNLLSLSSVMFLHVGGKSETMAYTASSTTYFVEVKQLIEIHYVTISLTAVAIYHFAH